MVRAPLRLALAASIAGAAWGTALDAHADLPEDAARVARLWSAEGAVVRRLPPAFLEAGRMRALDVLGSAPSAEAGECVTFAVLGPRAGEVVVAPGPRDVGDTALLAMALGDPRPPRAVAESGVAVVARCGDEVEEIARAVVLQRSPRSTVELLVARSRRPLSPITSLLPERVAGPSAPRGTPGRSLEIGPIDVRLARAEARARADGATGVERLRVRPTGAGRGEVALQLDPGCHRIELLAEARLGPRMPADVDAELRLASGQVVARDRGDATDARLDACVGEETHALLGYVGAPGAAALHVVDARWPVPASIPLHWGPRLRATAFAAMQKRQLPTPTSPPVHESFGVQGSTSVPLSVEPGRCYLAVAALAQGTARGMRIAAHQAARPALDEVGQRAEGVAIATCAEGPSLPVTVDLQSSGGWWLLAAWDLGAPALAAPPPEEAAE